MDPCVQYLHADNLFSLPRSGEVTIPNSSNYDPSAHLNFADISVDNSAMPSIIQVQIKASKTDHFRQGVNIHIGRTKNDLCPVTALLVYLAAHGNAPWPLPFQGWFTTDEEQIYY